MTPLRQRMIDDMRMRNLSDHTVKAYVRAVAMFAKHFGKSPAQLERTHVREYLLHLIKDGASWSLYNQVRCALHFCYHVSLGKDWPKEEIVCARFRSDCRSSSAAKKSASSSPPSSASRRGPC